jgi:hypothetical protein
VPAPVLRLFLLKEHLQPWVLALVPLPCIRLFRPTLLPRHILRLLWNRHPSRILLHLRPSPLLLRVLQRDPRHLPAWDRRRVPAGRIHRVLQPFQATKLPPRSPSQLLFQPQLQPRLQALGRPPRLALLQESQVPLMARHHHLQRRWDSPVHHMAHPRHLQQLWDSQVLMARPNRLRHLLGNQVPRTGHRHRL